MKPEALAYNGNAAATTAGENDSETLLLLGNPWNV